jgi:hypothetical protein
MEFAFPVESGGWQPKAKALGLGLLHGAVEGGQRPLRPRVKWIKWAMAADVCVSDNRLSNATRDRSSILSVV